MQAQDLVDVTVQTNVQFDQSTQLYSYHYSVTSLATSQQEVSKFAIAIDGGALNIQSPPGWESFLSMREPLLVWAATEVPESSLPPGFVPGPNISPSPFQIKPGETLIGFSYQSSEGPSTGKFFAQGFAPLPEADDAAEFDDAGMTITVFPDNSKEGDTVVPGLDDSLIFTGGRRPSVDGFLGFIGSENRETRSLPVTIIVRFGVNGENVDTTTFAASLNRVDVTNAFQLTGNGSEKLAIFELGSSPIVLGRNVLITSVDGIVPDTTRTATDGDAFTFFTVQ